MLVWAQGEPERLPDLVRGFCAEAAVLLDAVTRAVKAKDSQSIRRAAQRLYGMLTKLGVPQLCTLAASLEEIGYTHDLGAAAPIIDDLGAVLTSFFAYLEKKPWLRY